MVVLPETDDELVMVGCSAAPMLRRHPIRWIGWPATPVDQRSQDTVCTIAARFLPGFLQGRRFVRRTLRSNLVVPADHFYGVAARRCRLLIADDVGIGRWSSPR